MGFNRRGRQRKQGKLLKRYISWKESNKLIKTGKNGKKIDSTEQFHTTWWKIVRFLNKRVIIQTYGYSIPLCGLHTLHNN